MCDRGHDTHSLAAGRAQGWRARIRVHEAADLFPMIGPDELAELGEDIRRHGLRERLVFYGGETKPHDQAGLARIGQTLRNLELPLLDGRNRLAARDAADILTETALALEVERGRIVYGNPVEYVVSANLHRRHLAQNQKRELIAKLLRANPERSDRATAKLAKVSDERVGAKRRELEANAEIPHKAERTETDGRAARERKPASTTAAPQRPKAPPKPAPAPEPPKVEPPPEPPALAEVRAAIAADPNGALDALARLLFDERERLADIPDARRIMASRRLMSALGLTPHDLIASGGAP